jgi:hypothetical protein
MVVKEIDLEKCRPYKDFGRGFYLTAIKPQAEKMAKRVSKIYGAEPAISKFSFNAEALRELSVIEFKMPSTEWAQFVMNNRNRKFANLDSPNNNQDNKYDVVIGPVANDDMALLFRQFSDGIITVEMLTREMKFKELTNQYSFHTKRAIEMLKFEG